jgi:hypothetical protein
MCSRDDPLYRRLAQVRHNSRDDLENYHFMKSLKYQSTKNPPLPKGFFMLY